MPKFYKTAGASDADIKVFITDIRMESDCVIFETSNAWDATESLIWFYTDIRSEADKVVFFADSQWDADLTVFKTDIQSDVEWINSGKRDVL